MQPRHPCPPISGSTTSTSNRNPGCRASCPYILNWLITNKKTFNNSWSLDQVQFGPEIVSDGAVHGYIVDSFSVSSSQTSTEQENDVVVSRFSSKSNPTGPTRGSGVAR
jgi:hypothetical protein